MEGLVFRELQQFHDDRGWLVEIFRSDEIDFSPAMSYVSLTKPGIARGPHEHRDQSDYFCFFGSFRLYVWDNRPGAPDYRKLVTFETNGRPHMAIVPPCVVHAYRNVGQTDGLVINLPNRLFRGSGRTEPVDEVRYEDDPASPFRVDA